MGDNRHVKTFATFIASAPYSSFSKIHIRFNKFFIASWANKFIGYSIMLFCINISALDMFDKRAFSNIEGFAVGARITN